jgi:hypothetical protein
MAEDPGSEPIRAGRAGRSRRSPLLGTAGTFIVLAASIGAILWVYLGPYVRYGWTVPIGSDTSTYIWRARMIQATGLSSLANGSPFQFQANGSNADRAGLLIVSSALRAVFNIGAWRFMWILPAVMAVMVLMAAWALARAFKEPWWAGAVYGMAAATSAAFAVTARGYFDNLVADPLLIGVAALALFSVAGGPGVIAGVLLLVAALVTHWAFGVYFVAVLIGFALVLIPASLRARREGTTIFRTPSGRVATIALASVAAGGAMILWALPGAQVISTGARTAYDRKLQAQLPWYRLGFALPLAVAGAVALPFGEHRKHRIRGLLLMLVWLAPVAGGALLFWRGGTLAMQRLLGFAFPIYLLAAAALVWIGRTAAVKRGWLKGVLAGLCVIAIAIGAVASSRNAASSIGDAQPMEQPLTFQILRTAGDYLRAVRPTGKIVYVIDQAADQQAFGMVGAFRRVRAQAPGAVVANVSTYLGDYTQLLAGKATSRPDVAGFDEVSNRYWNAFEALGGDVQVVLIVEPFNSNFGSIVRQHPDWQIAPGLLLVKGPAAPSTLTFADPPVRPRTSVLVAESLLALFLLTVCGIGWAVALLGSGWVERVMLAPCLGMAAIMVVGILGGRAGVSMKGTPMLALTVLAAALGWVPAAIRWFGSSRRAQGVSAPEAAAAGSIATESAPNA